MTRWTPVSLAGRILGLLSLTALLLLAVPGARAQTDAYSIEVAVADRGVDEQEDAYVAALRRVLLNNSGDKTLLNRDSVRDGLRNARDFVSAFSYRMPPPGTVISTETPITEQVRRTGQATQLMMVSFDRDRVRQLIDESSAESEDRDEQQPPVVRSNRALIWMLIQDDGRDIMISDPAAVNVQSRAREIAGAQGIALTFPAGDAEDAAAVSLEDMLTQDIARLQAASARYEQDTVLIATLARSGASGWQGRWLRLRGDDISEATHDATSLDEALQKGLTILGVQGSVDESYRYGGSASSDTEGLVWVGSVNSLENYASVMNFFQGLPTVSTVYPKEVSDTSIVFAILPRSALNDVETALASQSRLRRTAPPVVGVPGSLMRNADLSLDYGG